MASNRGREPGFQRVHNPLAESRGRASGRVWGSVPAESRGSAFGRVWDSVPAESGGRAFGLKIRIGIFLKAHTKNGNVVGTEGR